MGKTVRERFIRTWMGANFRIVQCMFAHRTQGLFLSEYVDDMKMAGKDQNLAPM